MKTSVIRLRVVDFLRQYPPFEYFSADELLPLAGSGKVQFHQADEYVLAQGQPRREWVWMIQQGTVELVREIEGVETVIDILSAGDLLGAGWSRDGGVYQESARTASDVMLYALDLCSFESLMRDRPEAGRFMSALASMCGEAKALEPVQHDGRIPWFRNPVVPMDFLRRRSADRAEEPPALAPPGLTVGEYALQMVRAGASSLGLTRDSTCESGIDALLTTDDLAVSGGYDVVAVFRAITRAADFEEIRWLRGRGEAIINASLSQPEHVEWCSAVAGELGKACIRRTVAIAERCLEAQHGSLPPTAYSVLVFGSAGRSDTVLPEAPELGVVCAPVQSDSEEHSFATFGRMLQAAFPASSSGIPVLTLGGWKQRFANIVADPVMERAFLHRGMFDLAQGYGDFRLVEALQRHIDHEIRASAAFIPLLANDTMVSLPPLTFYGDMVVDLDGARRPVLDLRRSAIDPLTDVGRVFALAHGLVGTTNTLERLRAAASALPSREALFRDAIEAFTIVRFCEYQSADTSVAARGLTRYNRSLLKKVFRSVHRLLEFTYERSNWSRP